MDADQLVSWCVKNIQIKLWNSVFNLFYKLQSISQPSGDHLGWYENVLNSKVSYQTPEGDVEPNKDPWLQRNGNSCFGEFLSHPFLLEYFWNLDQNCHGISSLKIFTFLLKTPKLLLLWKKKRKNLYTRISINSVTLGS